VEINILFNKFTKDRLFVRILRFRDLLSKIGWSSSAWLLKGILILFISTLILGLIYITLLFILTLFFDLNININIFNNIIIFLLLLFRSIIVVLVNFYNILFRNTFFLCLNILFLLFYWWFGWRFGICCFFIGSRRVLFYLRRILNRFSSVFSV